MTQISRKLTPEQAKQEARRYTYNDDVVNPRRCVALSNDAQDTSPTNENLLVLVDAFINIGWDLQTVLQTPIPMPTEGRVFILTTYILTRKDNSAYQKDK